MRPKLEFLILGASHSLSFHFHRFLVWSIVNRAFEQSQRTRRRIQSDLRFLSMPPPFACSLGNLIFIGNEIHSSVCVCQFFSSAICVAIVRLGKKKKTKNATVLCSPFAQCDISMVVVVFNYFGFSLNRYVFSTFVFFFCCVFSTCHSLHGHSIQHSKTYCIITMATIYFIHFVLSSFT